MHQLRVVREKAEGYEGFEGKVSSSRAVYRAFRGYFEPLDREHVVVLALDQGNAVVGFHVVSVGSLSSSIVHPREVFKAAILANAASIIVMHNHPSGRVDPSGEDREITGRLQKAGEILGIRVLDHLIFGDGRYFSFVEAGELEG